VNTAATSPKRTLLAIATARSAESALSTAATGAKTSSLASGPAGRSSSTRVGAR
jgi:hypothetical protein